MKPLPDLCRLMAACEAMLDFPRVVNLCHLLMSCENVIGDVVEMGCYRGHTAALMAAITGKRLWLYDSFQGLPEPGPEDEGRRSDFQKGYLKADREDFAITFHRAGLDHPNLVVGDISMLYPAYLPEKIAFAHIDLDLYEPTSDALDTVWQRMSSGGVVVIDDANNPDLPGVRRALMKFASEVAVGDRIFERGYLKHSWLIRA